MLARKFADIVLNAGIAIARNKTAHDRVDSGDLLVSEPRRQLNFSVTPTETTRCWIVIEGNPRVGHRLAIVPENNYIGDNCKQAEKASRQPHDSPPNQGPAQRPKPTNQEGKTRNHRQDAVPELFSVPEARAGIIRSATKDGPAKGQ